ncbi:hypothetical protein PVBG_03318 [Plasmodium vivax Brazil I]|uniref:Variable surface protein Vir35 n=1 Tax=Plasmodium vivax (strain Brazil I) TaxID=1033975 RepID=A0A0J9VGT7_PLAV1|nr:hypothetical protein PVBG_03318 [Plasmodium vivax Brazil I]
MILLSNCFLRKNIKFTGILKNVTFIFLMWTLHPNYDGDTFLKCLPCKLEQNNALNIIFSRLLAKHELQREVKYTDKREKLSHDSVDKRSGNINNMPTYSQLNVKKKNNLDAYMNIYKKRYAKKKGFAKLDCYCEKKVFDKIHYVEKVAENLLNDEKRFRKFILKKYGIGLIIFALLPLLGFIVPFLFGGESPPIKLCHSECDQHQSEVTDKKKHVGISYKTILSKDSWYIIEKINIVYVSLSIILFLSVIIYALIKVIKYQRLKSGKEKMGLKEYCFFCKDVFV